MSALIKRWREDHGGTYQTWFLWEERLKNFRSIRTGLAEVVREIEADTFGNVYKGSSLEPVVGSIAEQRQIFKGADHAFLWKPKLRIPDIYENRENQLAFGRFLNTCTCCVRGDDVVAAVHQLDQHQIKGLGPAVANLLYFLHPTLVPPFNTAIVNGYNALTGAKVRLGKWAEYVAMRAGILRLNELYRDQLSNDLGAIGGLLFDIGTGRYAPPPLDKSAESLTSWLHELQRTRDENAAAVKAMKAAEQNDFTHTQIQGWLRDLGKALGFSVWVASNDRGRSWGNGLLGEGCLPALPAAIGEMPGADAVRLIDVLWLEPSTGKIAAGFEVEHTTSIYSGIMRLLDLALGAPEQTISGLFLVAPDSREDEVREQLMRPVFRRIADLKLRFLPYSELEVHREAITRFGHGLKAIEAIARTL